MGGSDKPELFKNGKRLDGRMPDELRDIKMEVGVIKNAVGSAYIEWGNNKIIAAVYGPKEALPKHVQDPERAIIKCRYTMSPFSSLEDHGRSGPNRRSTEISKVTKEVFENVIMLEKYPGAEIDIFVEVLQGDGGTRAAGITAASIAVAASGIPMTDLPFGVSFGKVGDQVILDLNKIEDNYSDADMPIAISPRTGDILLLQMDGTLTKEDIKVGMQMVNKAQATIVKLQQDALRKQYEHISEKYKK